MKGVQQKGPETRAFQSSVSSPAIAHILNTGFDDVTQSLLVVRRCAMLL